MINNKRFFIINLIVLFIQYPLIINCQIIESGFKVNAKKQLHTLIFKKDKSLKGQVLKLEDEIITFKDTEGEISIIERKEILKINFKKNTYDTGLTKDIGLSPTAFNYRNDFAEFSNTDLLFNSLSFGLSDNISFSSGIFMSPDFSSFFLVGRIKLTYSLNSKIHIGLIPSIGFLNVPKDDTQGNVQVFPTFALSIGHSKNFLNFTYTRNHNIHSMAGMKPKLDDTTDIFTFGGKLSINDKWTLLTDNIVFLNSDNPLLEYAPSIGIKYLPKGAHEIELLVYNYLEVIEESDEKKLNDWIPFPLLSYSYYFN